MSITIRPWVVKDFEPLTVGDNTVLTGATGVIYVMKRIILMSDSATNIYFKNSAGKKKTCTFYFPHVGGWSELDQLNISFGSGGNIILVADQAANLSLMIDVQKQT